MSILKGLYQAIEQANARLAEKKTYREKGEDLLRCSICDEQVQMEVKLLRPEPQIVTCMCSCDIQRANLIMQAEIERDKQIKIAKNKDTGLTDTKYMAYRWELDDSPSSTQSKLCRAYADSWDEIKASSVGLYLFGPVGSGKTFYAACIANQLLDQGVRAAIITLSDLLNKMFSSRDKEEVIRWIQGFELLIVDDFGAERDTEYAKEQVFAIVDARSRSGKPTIFTSNVSLQSLKGASDLTNRRINDRVIEMASMTVAFEKGGRREKVGDARRDHAIEILHKKVTGC